MSAVNTRSEPPIEYGFKQVKNELGWHDYRLTDYASIERWWELIFSAYLLVSLHADEFKQHQQIYTDDSTNTAPLPFSVHPHWELGTTWKSARSQFAITAATVLLLGMVRSLVTGISHSWTSTRNPSTDGLHGYLPHSSNLPPEGSLTALELLFFYHSNKRGNTPLLSLSE